MFIPTQRKTDTNRIVIKIDPTKVARGHQAHVTGAGVHHDKRTKRNRTRGNQRRAALREWN